MRDQAEFQTGGTVRENLIWCRQRLAWLDDGEAARESEIFLEEILGVTRTELHLNPERVLSGDEKARLTGWINRRKTREPVAYILGKQPFWNEVLTVNPFCLIPRPETEQLVEVTAEFLKKKKSGQFKILDLGAGSGAIGIALLRQLSTAEVCFVDQREEILQVIRENLTRYHLGDNARLVTGDLLRDWAFLPDERWDAVVSNPPYIPTADLAGLMAEVQFEPREALDGGPDGLQFYRAIIDKTPRVLKDDGFLVLEIGIAQGGSVRELLEKSRHFSAIEIRKDFAGIERVVTAKKQGRHG